ncbi:tetratricopeptide repeat protein [Paenibacillus lemnae]|uniref:Tetratricopeptide repeat protein n=1 Tax=Paenibacillus lemnae TaxID=1330551 RepID=A0A848M8G7_PAELE|nr:tetratricopeptide repeat protein [Paenibacillus lemnae]NMO96906.1 tetratricopeptide repeat protein [Paenibacillus lemnae]
MRELIQIKPEHNTPPPTQPFELGQWYEKRGSFHQALSCFKEAALDCISTGCLSVDQNASAENWIHYGRLQGKLNHYEEASQAFRHALQFDSSLAQLALQEWASLLHRSGWCDHDIFQYFTGSNIMPMITYAMAAQALFSIGAYKESALCFHNSEYTDPCIRLMHVRSLIFIERMDEAFLILRDLHKLSDVPSCDMKFIKNALYLCVWRRDGKAPLLTDGMQHSSIAVTAIGLGMITEAEHLLSQEGRSGELELISILYQEGYIQTALDRLKHIQLCSSELTSSDAARLQMMKGESLYDQHRYHEAAEHFKVLRLKRPDLMEARYGEAACCLQLSLLSLSSRLEKMYRVDKVKEQITEYMNYVYSALHIVESSGWHTSWTPGQLRRDSAPRRLALLN